MLGQVGSSEQLSWEMRYYVIVSSLQHSRLSRLARPIWPAYTWSSHASWMLMMFSNCNVGEG